MPRMTRRLTGLLLGVAYATQVTGCSTWVSQPAAPAAVVAAYPEHELRVTLADGRRLELRAARMEGDSLRGQPVVRELETPAPFEARAAGAPDTAATLVVTIPVADVVATEVRKPDGRRTAGAVLGVVVGLALVIGFGVAMSNFEPLGGWGSGVRAAQ